MLLCLSASHVNSYFWGLKKVGLICTRNQLYIVYVQYTEAFSAFTVNSQQRIDSGILKIVMLFKQTGIDSNIVVKDHLSRSAPIVSNILTTVFCSLVSRLRTGTLLWNEPHVYFWPEVSLSVPCFWIPWWPNPPRDRQKVIGRKLSNLISFNFQKSLH